MVRPVCGRCRPLDGPTRLDSPDDCVTDVCKPTRRASKLDSGNGNCNCRIARAHAYAQTTIHRRIGQSAVQPLPEHHGDSAGARQSLRTLYQVSSQPALAQVDPAGLSTLSHAL